MTTIFDRWRDVKSEAELLSAGIGAKVRIRPRKNVADQYIGSGCVLTIQPNETTSENEYRYGIHHSKSACFMFHFSEFQIWEP